MSKAVSPRSGMDAVGSALPRPRRANRLPVYLALGLFVVSGAVIIHGISGRGFSGASDSWLDDEAGPPSDFGDRLKEGIPDGIIAEPAPPELPRPIVPAPQPAPIVRPVEPQASVVVEDWRARLQREQEEQVLRELHRQELMALQSDQTALDAPISVSLAALASRGEVTTAQSVPSTMRPDLSALYRAGSGPENQDQDQQAAKRAFLENSYGDDTVLDYRLTEQESPFELKRGSIIPAVMLTGINSDLPGRIIAQVSQNVFDSATGHHLLIPQGTKLFGQYDSDVSYGQDRVLVVWTDLIFPDGASLSLDGMAGSDSQGFGGFSDQVDAHYLETFGSALLVAAFGAGVDMLLPGDGLGGAEDEARGSLGESLGQLGSQTVEQNLNVQPTLSIRPGYVFNVIVEQDIVFSGSR